jgi:hypothetical protein
VGLPQSRPRTYGNETPLVPGDINDVFDAINASKHDEREFPVHASAFRGGSGSPVFDGIAWTAAGAFKLYAPVLAPVGDRITRCRFNYNRENAGHVIVSLNYWQLSDGTGPNVIVQFDDNVAPVASTYHELAAINVTIVSGRAYFLKFDIDATAGAANAQALGAAFFTDNL